MDIPINLISLKFGSLVKYLEGALQKSNPDWSKGDPSIFQIQKITYPALLLIIDPTEHFQFFLGGTQSLAATGLTLDSLLPTGISLYFGMILFFLIFRKYYYTLLAASLNVVFSAVFWNNESLYLISNYLCTFLPPQF